MLPAAVGPPEAGAEVAAAGPVAEAVRRDEPGHEDRLDEAPVAVLEPDRDLRVAVRHELDREHMLGLRRERSQHPCDQHGSMVPEPSSRAKPPRSSITAGARSA
jgi:hypothetical protein